MEIPELVNSIYPLLKPYRSHPHFARSLIIRDREIKLIYTKSIIRGDYILDMVTQKDIEEGFGSCSWALIETKLKIARKDGLI